MTSSSFYLLQMAVLYRRFTDRIHRHLRNLHFARFPFYDQVANRPGETPRPQTNGRRCGRGGSIWNWARTNQGTHDGTYRLESLVACDGDDGSSYCSVFQCLFPNAQCHNGIRHYGHIVTLCAAFRLRSDRDLYSEPVCHPSLHLPSASPLNVPLLSHSDVHRERFWHISVSIAVGIVGFIIAISTMNIAARYISLWVLPSSCFLVSSSN